MNAPMIAAELDDIPPAKSGRPQLWTDAELASFVELLAERPALLSPSSYRARTTARGHAEKLRERLAEHGCIVSVRVWAEPADPDAIAYRWAVIRQEAPCPTTPRKSPSPQAAASPPKSPPPPKSRRKSPLKSRAKSPSQAAT